MAKTTTGSKRKVSPCGCSVRHLRIRYCPVHAAAGDMLTALEAIDSVFRDWEEERSEMTLADHFVSVRGDAALTRARNAIRMARV